MCVVSLYDRAFLDLDDFLIHYCSFLTINKLNFLRNTNTFSRAIFWSNEYIDSTILIKKFIFLFYLNVEFLNEV